MGQKTHPVGFRLGIVKDWNSTWFSEKHFADWLNEDLKVRKYVTARVGNAGIASIKIKRFRDKVTIIVATSRPGVVIGKKGTKADQLRAELLDAQIPAEPHERLVAGDVPGPGRHHVETDRRAQPRLAEGAAEEEQAVEAALESGLKDPFVHVRELGDHSVLYRVAGLLENVESLISARSRLRESMLDTLHAAEIEIVSPTFMNSRVYSVDREFIPEPSRKTRAPQQAEASA